MQLVLFSFLFRLFFFVSVGLEKLPTTILLPQLLVQIYPDNQEISVPVRFPSSIISLALFKPSRILRAKFYTT